MVYMSKKKEKIDLNNLAPEEELKYEIAKELGLLDKVMEQIMEFEYRLLVNRTP